MAGRVNMDWDEIGISNDFLFGKLMQNPRLCLGVLKRVLPELDIERIEYPELQKAIREDADARSVRLDVYVRDDKKTVFFYEQENFMKENISSPELTLNIWSNDACRGYVIMAMQDCGFTHKDISRVVNQLYGVFDLYTLNEAEQKYYNGDY